MKNEIARPVLACLALVAMVASPAFAQESDWVLPRTPDGKPDFQGNWSNATLTAIQRAAGMGRVLTPEQVAAMEGDRASFIQENSQDSDPDRPAPAAGGEFTGNALFDAASGGTGGYNLFYIDAGDRVAVYNGEPRSSLVTVPDDGRIPALTDAARTRAREAGAARAGMGQYDNPENRPLAERCMLSFGSNAGPPMLPNYFYNNNYTIVQTLDHIMIMTEMVHDVRVIPIGDKPDVPEDYRPWFGVSWAHWEGDTLVIETTNISPQQMRAYAQVFAGGVGNPKLTERLTRVGPYSLNYEFTVEDPDTFTEVWGGEVPFNWLPDRVYEYACHEANYALFNVLSGARAQEREESTGNLDRE
ncbi:MAG: hypothetical protein OEU54_04630 [Gemmatimonadota bacterium]|nr:hypothetical protein [Gemmatimonadota bacterium]